MCTNLLKNKKIDFHREKLRENVGKSKEPWKAIKTLSLLSKITPVSQTFLNNEEKISFHEKTNNNSFKNFYTNLALNLVNKIPNAPNKCYLDSFLTYYN